MNSTSGGLNSKNETKGIQVALCLISMGKIRTKFQSRLDNYMNIANNFIQRRQKGETSRLPRNGLYSEDECGKEEANM